MKNSKNKVFSVLIPDGESWLAYSVQSCLAHIPGVKIIVLSNNAWDPMRFSRYTSQFFSYVGQGGDDAKLAAIQNTLKRTHVDVVLPVDTTTMRLLSLHRPSLPANIALAPLPKVEAIDIAENKWLLAKWLQKHRIPCPATLLYRADSSFEQALYKLAFPVLLKPTQQIADIGSGGRGIHIFDQPTALLEFCKENTSVEYVVQSFISGYDIDCSVLCREGKIEAYTIQKGFLAGSERFKPPAGIYFLENAKVYAVVKALVEKMNWTGIAHFDLRYDEHDQQVKVIEINARFWGSLLGSFCAGVNFPYLTCLAGLGLAIPKTGFQPLRYVNGSTGVKVLCQKLLHKKQENIVFDNSALDFVIKNPLPRVFSYLLKTYTRLMPSFSTHKGDDLLPGVKNKL
jgi:predicted ATP-grasp superfamily ATP-dependent carboligase